MSNKLNYLYSEYARRLAGGYDVGPVFEKARAEEELPGGMEGLSLDASPEIAVVWRDSAIPVKVYLRVHDTLLDSGPMPTQGVRIFLRVPEALLRPGTNRIEYYVQFWSGGWEYQLWIYDQGKSTRIAHGRDDKPDDPKNDYVAGILEVER